MRDEARRSYEEARTQFDAGHFAEALVAFQRTFALRSNPVVLIPISQCQEHLGQIGEAITSAERYLRERADAPDRAQVQERLTVRRATPARVHVTSEPAGGHVRVDGNVMTQTTPTDLSLPAGHHTITVDLEGYAATAQAFDLTAGQAANAEVSMTVAPHVPATPPVVLVSRGPGAGFWVLSSVAVGAAIAGTVLGVLTLGEHSSFNDNPTQASADRGTLYANVADVCFLTAIVAAGVATVVYFVGRHGHAEQRQTASNTLHLGLAPTGAILNF